jgi:hypothetical protein
MQLKPVLRKVDFVRRYSAGEFGNRSPTWNNFSEYCTSGYSGLIHLRNRVANGPTFYNVSFEEAVDKYAEVLSQGVKPADIYVSAMAPEHHKVFQGEVFRGLRGYSLFYSCLPVPMREGLAADGKQVYGATAYILLKDFLCSRSYEWLEYLLETYPDHVVEFSTYEREWGTDPGFNTVFWEVRKY